MVEWSATADAVCGFGDRDTVTLPTEAWRPGGNPPAIDSRVDAVAVGTTDAVRVPDGAALAGASDGALSATRLPDGTHEVAADGALHTRVAFAGPAAVDPASTGTWLRFPERTPVAVGFREGPATRETVAVPPTPSGIATAVTAAARTHRTDGPARSHPGYRPPTPRVVLREDATTDVDPASDRPTVAVPADVVSVLVAAPLSYYLGADLRTGEGDPAVRADDVRYAFSPRPAFAAEVGEALRAVCGLDGRLRAVPGEDGPLEPGIDADQDLAEADPIDRFAAAVAAAPDYDETWPLATYVDDDVGNARYLPYLLDNLSLVHPAEASPLDPKALLKRSLDEFFRGEAASVDAVDPTLADARFHAWRGEGTPVDADTLVGDGPAHATDRFEVDVVCNDEAMGDERRVAEVYRTRLEDRDVAVRVHEQLTSVELASVLERDVDLVHFIGHCEIDGLVCPDGTLSAASLETCGATVAFLNACGSYHEGYDLVRRGATAAAVTLTEVLDEQAMTVGTTFADLLASGVAVTRALSLARGEILAGRDYVVVGDGTHRLRPPRGEAGVFRLERDGDEFLLAYDPTAPDAAGRRYRDLLHGGDRICGVPTGASLPPAAVRDLFERHRAPVRFEGEVRWTDGLLDALSDL
jgi:hypothetical protein